MKRFSEMTLDELRDCPIIEARVYYSANIYEYEMKKEQEKTGQLNLFDFAN